jgi:hypothetical protein
VFSRIVADKEYTFGVSGKLWRNGLVMYDHQTKTLWSGITGEALEGPLKGNRLEIIAAVPKVRWQDWKAAYPQSQVLTSDGFQDFDQDRYADYHLSGMTGLFPPEHDNARLHPKALVMGIRFGAQARAYPLDAFVQRKIVTDRFAGKKLVIYRDPASEASAVYERHIDGVLLSFRPGKTWILLEDTTTGSTWNVVTGTAVTGPMQGKQLRRVPHVNIYWFAWVDFYPQTTLYSSADASEVKPSSVNQR